MRDTGRDLKAEHRETARGDLAVNVREVANLSVGVPSAEPRLA